MNVIEVIPSESTFIEWVNRKYEDLNLTTEEARLLLDYVLGHGCGVCLDTTDTILLLDTDEPENGVIAKGFEELIDRISSWNYEFIEDYETVGAFREQVFKNAEVIDSIMDRVGSRCGFPIGTPTVKELIAVLRNLPEDYRVTCCGAENYLYLFSKDKYITIDNENYLVS